MSSHLSWLVCGACGALLLGAAPVAFGAPSIRVLGFGAEGENQTYVPALPAVFGNREKKLSSCLMGLPMRPPICAPTYFRLQRLTMPLVKDVHLKDGITFPNASRQDLMLAVKIPDVKRHTEVLVRLSLVPNGPQARPLHLMDIPFEVFPASVTQELKDLLKPKPDGSAPVVVFGPGQKLRHFLTGLHVSFEDGGSGTPDRFDASRIYFGELATDEQFQQAQDRSAGARLVLFSPDESLPTGVYAERSNSGVLVHVTSPLLDNLDDDPRAQLGIMKIIHFLSTSSPSAN